MVTETATQPTIVQPDGTVKIPADVLERAGIKPGDKVFFWTTARGELTASMFPKLTLDEMIERYGSKEPVGIDWPKLMEEAEEAAAQEVIEAMKRNA